MAGQTPNYNLVKPEPEEFYDVSVPNGNMEKIDATLKALSDALGGIDVANITQLIGAVDGRLTTHSGDKYNPHAVTKAQVGLGNVENYAVASQVEAETGMTNSKYMTPLRTKQAIDKKMIPVLESIAYNYAPQIVPNGELTQVELDTTREPLVLCNINGTYWYVETQFYRDKNEEQRNQLARSYMNKGDIMQRACYNGVWTPWSPSLQSLFTSVSNGKAAIANAITRKGKPTAVDAEFAVMAANIDALSGGKAGGQSTGSYILDIPVGTFGFTPKIIITEHILGNDAFSSFYVTAGAMHGSSPARGYVTGQYGSQQWAQAINATMRNGGFLITARPNGIPGDSLINWVAIG